MDDMNRVYREGFMIAEIPLLPADKKHLQTFYNQHGDWFAWTCLVIAIIAFGNHVLASRRETRTMLSGAPLPTP